MYDSMKGGPRAVEQSKKRVFEKFPTFLKHFPTLNRFCLLQACRCRSSPHAIASESSKQTVSFNFFFALLVDWMVSAKESCQSARAKPSMSQREHARFVMINTFPSYPCS